MESQDNINVVTKTVYGYILEKNEAFENYRKQKIEQNKSEEKDYLDDFAEEKKIELLELYNTKSTPRRAP
jgi:hypothetical protein